MSDSPVNSVSAGLSPVNFRVILQPPVNIFFPP